ncbi:MAG: RNA-directed DNA polymerase [Pedobacter sp.]|nr:MAG: RNA-directed DNA polymerase [Pedobacter sp.]
MTEQKLIEKGYFAKELPPQFVTYPLANKLSTINAAWNSRLSSLTKPRKQFFSETKSTIYNIPKVGLSRRVISIPNPVHQTNLVETIINRWNEIDLILTKSNSSYSKPKEDLQNTRAYVTEHNFTSFKRARFIGSFDNYHQVKSDISKFYGSIYTHSIPWIMHTKPVAKINRADNTLIGNLLDKILRTGNSGQTVGIPVGPDTSLIIAEIINCEIDNILQNKFKSNNIKFFRYIDDIYIYCDSYTEAEQAFKFYQKTLSEYQLEY